MIMRIDYSLNFMGKDFTAYGVDIGETDNPKWWKEGSVRHHKWSAICHAMPELWEIFGDIDEAYPERNPGEYGFKFVWIEEATE